MNDNQRNELNMGAATLEGLDNHNFFSANAAAVAMRDQLAADIDAVELADGQQISTSGTSQSENKAVVKHDLADQGEVIASAVCLFALANTDLITFGKYHKTMAQILKMSDADIVPFCSDLYTYAFGHGAGLLPFNITPLMLSDFQAQNQAFIDVKSAPRENTGDRHAATLDVATSLTGMISTLHWWDLFMSTVRKTQPSIYNAYHTWRKTADIGVRHISIRGVVKASDSGNELFKAKITITNLPVPKIATSGTTGIFRFLSLNPGDYSLKVELAGYQTLIIPVVSVKEGKITTQNITLVKL